MRVMFGSHGLASLVVSVSLAACSGGSASSSNAVDTGASGGTGATGATTSTGATSATGTQLPAGSGPVAIDDLAHELAVVTCNLIMRCNPNSSIATASYGQLCVTQLEKEFADQSISVLKAAIASGKSSYDAVKVRTCVDLYPQLACDYSNQSLLSPACSNIGGGTVPLGGACNSTFECEGSGAGAFCKSLASTCPGVCTTKAAAGEPCPVGLECQEGLKCDSNEHTCKVPLKLGDACGASGQNGGVCGGVTRCVEVTTGQFSCANLFGPTGGQEGDICSSSIGCAAGLSCVAERADGGSSVVYRCQKPPTSGGVCAYSLGGECPDGQYCPIAPADIGTSAPVCTAQVEPGQPCTGKYLFECKGDGRCYNGTCVGRQRLGGACVSNVDCYSNSCVNAVCTSPIQCQP